MHARPAYALAGLALAGTVTLPPVIAAADTDSTTIRGTEKIEKFTERDLGKRGPSQGDTLTYRSALLDSDGKKFGSVGGECVSIKLASGTLGLTHCSWNVQLADGQLALQGLYDFNRAKNVTPLVGGSGRYQGATGHYEDTMIKDERYEVTIRLDK